MFILGLEDMEEQLEDVTIPYPEPSPLHSGLHDFYLTLYEKKDSN
jgi:hypothetical protein